MRLAEFLCEHNFITKGNVANKLVPKRDHILIQKKVHFPMPGCKKLVPKRDHIFDAGRMYISGRSELQRKSTKIVQKGALFRGGYLTGYTLVGTLETI